MSKLYQILKSNYAPPPFPLIVPIKSHKLYIWESNFDGDPQKDWAVVKSPYPVSDEVAKEFVTYESGLDGWNVVPGFPYENADREWEWRLRRADCG